jgi:hypothetical protein
MGASRRARSPPVGRTLDEPAAPVLLNCRASPRADLQKWLRDIAASATRAATTWTRQIKRKSDQAKISRKQNEEDYGVYQ